MKIAYQHLLKFLIDKPSIQDLSDKLFQLGHEHEIEGSIFDMEFTPNRGDCLSLLGLARDLNVFYKTDLDLATFDDKLSPLDLNFINNAKDKCTGIAFLNIQVDEGKFEYKDYLNNYFTDLKIKKVNFFTDVSNYVAYEMGQPTHCYDFSSLDKDITLKENTDNLKFETLLGNNVELEGADLVFTSKNKIISLSGIMGGLNTSCSTETKNALIECAYFRPESIIGKALKYNLHSDASHKFERGADPSCHDKVLRRFIEIVKDHVRITKLELYKSSNDNFKNIELDFDLNKVNKILGLNVNNELYRESLIKLGFKIDKTIIVPPHRSDIQHQNDLAEELARVIGYNNIPLKAINITKDSIANEVSKENIIKSFLVDNGFSEAINYPFCAIRNSNLSIKLDNPLDSNREYLRTNVIDSLVENLIYNEKRQQDSIKIFEISDVYSIKDNAIKKDKNLALIVSGRRGHNYEDFSLKLDKKYLVDLFKKVKTDLNENITSIDRNKLNSKIKSPIYALEIKIQELYEVFCEYEPIIQPINSFIKYKKISEFPSSYRDLSFSVKNSEKVKDLVNILSSFNSDILKKSFLFDFFDNKKTYETKVGYRFIFQSDYKTLTDIEIDNQIEELISRALTLNSVSLPGSS